MLGIAAVQCVERYPVRAFYIDFAPVYVKCKFAFVAVFKDILPFKVNCAQPHVYSL